MKKLVQPKLNQLFLLYVFYGTCFFIYYTFAQDCLSFTQKRIRFTQSMHSFTHNDMSFTQKFSFFTQKVSFTIKIIVFTHINFKTFICFIRKNEKTDQKGILSPILTSFSLFTVNSQHVFLFSLAEADTFGSIVLFAPSIHHDFLVLRLHRGPERESGLHS
jgi:hypothetical protein